MRIAIVHHQYKKKGGMETCMFDLLQGFENDIVDVYVYRKDPNLLIPDHCNIIKSNFRFIPNKIRRYLFANKMKNKFVANNYDLIFNLMRAAIPGISICGGTHYGFSKYLHRKLKFFDKIEIKYEKSTYQTAKKIIAHSKMMQAEIVKFYDIDSAKIVVVYPPIDTDKYKYKLKSKINKKTTLLFPATDHKRKGLDVLLQAFEMLPTNDYELLVAGGKASGCCNKSNVKYLGFVDNMAELYQSVDFTILPSYYEPFGLVVVESLQCGTPVIISKFVGAKELLSNTEGIVLDNLEPATIAKTIISASKTTFNVKQYFAARHGLEIATHITKLKQICIPN